MLQIKHLFSKKATVNYIWKFIDSFAEEVSFLLDLKG